MSVEQLIDPEQVRLQAVAALDSPGADPHLDELVKTAALVCGVPIALVSLVGADWQHFKAQVGLDGVSGTPRAVSFCAHALPHDSVFEVADATLDRRFKANPLVTGDPSIRFYAGAPLRMRNGLNAGALCVIDRKPRVLDATQRQILAHLATIAVHLLESKRAAHAQALIAAEFRTLTETSPLGIFATDAAGQCTQVNPQWMAIYELGAAQSISSGWSSRIHPDDRSAVATAWTAAAAVGKDFDMEFRLLVPGEVIKTVRALSRAYLGPDGQVAGHVGTVEDVTQRHALQRRLDDKRNRLAAIIDATGAATFEWNVQTGEMRFNENWARMTGHRLADFKMITPTSWRERVHPDDLVALDAKIAAHLADPVTPYLAELRKRHVAGHWVWLLNRGQVTSFTADGRPEWIYGVQVDISEGKAQQEAVRRSESLLTKTGEMAGIGGWDLDLVTNDLTWTAQTCRIHGFEPGFKPDLAQAIEFYAPTSRPVIRAAIDVTMQTGQGWDLELQLIRRDGVTRWVRAVGSVEFDAAKPVRLYGAVQDITDRIARQRQVVEEHHRMVLAKESGGIGIWEYGIAQDALTWDGQMRRLYGHGDGSEIPAEQMWCNGLHPDDGTRVEAEIATAIQSGGRFHSEFRVIWPDGSQRHIRSMADVSETAEAGRKLIGVNWDVTELRVLAAELAEQHRLTQITLRSIGDAVITTDAKGLVTWLNPIAELMTGWPQTEAAGRPLEQIFRIVQEDTRDPAENPLAACLAQHTTVFATGSVLMARDGRHYGIENSAAPITDDDGQVLGVVLVFNDVTAERRLNGEMTYRATHDVLTGSKNRHEFETQLARVQVQSKVDSSAHAMMFIDLDQFKQINDACGHAAGDEVLQQVNRLFAEAVRAGDTLARLGGDEFGILLEHCPMAAAQRIAQVICDRLDAYRYVQDGRHYRIGASIGLVPVDGRWLTVEAMMQAADASCSAAKESGRNRVQVWQDSAGAITARHSERHWISRLEAALDEGRFVLYAQPILALADDTMPLHAEILLRMIDEAGNTVLPGVFLPAAERFGLATRIDLWVLRHAVRIIGDLPNLAKFDTIGINLSGRSIGARAFHARALAILQAAGPQICGRLSLEMKEAAALANIADASVFIDAVHRLGVRVALDDFGAGATSLGYLKLLKVDSLKIDGQFIQNLMTDKLSQVTVRSFVEIARVIGIPTVAEYVDQPALLDALRDLGVDFAQGFLIGKPAPLTAMGAEG